MGVRRTLDRKQWNGEEIREVDRRAKAYEEEGMNSERAYARAYAEVNAVRVRRITREISQGRRDLDGSPRRRVY